MFDSLVVSFLWILFFNLNTYIESLFLPIGTHSRFVPGMNSASCGLHLEPRIINVNFRKKCLKNYYENKTYAIDDKGFIWLGGPELPGVQNRMIDADIAQPTDAPWAVYIEIHKRAEDAQDNYKVCSGVLITFEAALTAGHCLDDITTGTVHVYAGSVRRRQGMKIKARIWIINPDYIHNTWPRRRFDLAVVKLEKRFPQMFFKSDSNFIINTICLPNQTYDSNRHYEIATNVGFGGQATNQRSDYLRKRNVTIVPAHVNGCGANVLCSFDMENGPRNCYGDSGGPLFQYDGNRAVLTALFTGKVRNEGNCETSHVNLYTPIAHHIHWIKDRLWKYPKILKTTSKQTTHINDQNLF